MNETNLYYTAPDQSLFDEVKAAAIEIWETYDDTYGYASEKINRVKSMGNISDNFMTIVAMFDGVNQTKLAFMISKEAGRAIYDRYVAGGGDGIFMRAFIAKESLSDKD